MQGVEPVRDVLETLAEERNPLYEEIADITIHTDDQSAKIVANQIIELLEKLINSLDEMKVKTT